MKKPELKYIELKSGYGDDGPAWIGRVLESKSGKTVYFNNHAFQKWNGVLGNYYDLESGEEYWISGVKKDENNRHSCGKGKIIIDKKVVDEYLQIVEKDTLNPKLFTVEEIEDNFPVERINEKLNK